MTCIPVLGLFLQINLEGHLDQPSCQENSGVTQWASRHRGWGERLVKQMVLSHLGLGGSTDIIPAK